MWLEFLTMFMCYEIVSFDFLNDLKCKIHFLSSHLYKNKWSTRFACRLPFADHWLEDYSCKMYLHFKWGLSIKTKTCNGEIPSKTQTERQESYFNLSFWNCFMHYPGRKITFNPLRDTVLSPAQFCIPGQSGYPTGLTFFYWKSMLSCSKT